MDEGLFKPRFAGQAAYFTPPIAPWHAGPAGFAYNPGTALDDAWRGIFFGSVFTGTPSGSSVRGFTLAPQGAGFRLAEDRLVLQGLQVTGLKFGPDGALYLADWIEGWNPKDRGRIWKLDVADSGASPGRTETRTLIAANFKERSVPELLALLRHGDMRVRTKAQFELVDRGAASDLLASARQNASPARANPRALGNRPARAQGPDAGSSPRRFPEGRRSGDPRAGGEAHRRSAIRCRVGRPAPAAARPGCHARASSRPKRSDALGMRPAIPPIIEMLAENNDEDVYLRHAGALALARIGETGPVVALANHPSRAVRLAAVIALRRMHDAGVARFLSDRDELVVTEAARAINDDGGIEGALPSPRSSAGQRSSAEPLVRRAISANLRLGTEEAARRVATFAARTSENDEMRVEAISVLGVWPKPSILDRVDGTHLGPVQRDSASPARRSRGSSSRSLPPEAQAFRWRSPMPSADCVSRARRRSCSPRCGRRSHRRFGSPRSVRSRRSATGALKKLSVLRCRIRTRRCAWQRSARSHHSTFPRRRRRSCWRQSWAVRGRSANSNARWRHSGRFKPRRAARC